LTGVDARQEDDVELSSTSDGEIRPAVLDVLVAVCDALILTTVPTDEPLTTTVATDDDETAILFVLAL